MRQVPQYLVTGSGRVARHFRHYFSLLNIPHTAWSRREQTAEELRALSKTATHILILLSDGAIEPFVLEHLKDARGQKIHFSGALASSLAFGAHPLMTFGPQLYTLDQYRAIPFVVDDDAPPFAELLPGLDNPHTVLKKDLKAKYHALCCLGANYSCLLWQKFFKGLRDDCGIPPEFGRAFLKQQTDNLLADWEHALTGPLLRGDMGTIEKHLKALEGDAYRAVYQSFIDAYTQEKKNGEKQA